MPNIDALVDPVARWIDEAALCETPFQASLSFGRRIPISEHEGSLDLEPTEASVRRAAAWAFSYHLEITQVDEKWRVQLIPYLQDSSGNSTPPRVEAVSDLGVEIWKKLLGRVKSEFGKARLHHLLFQRSVDNPRHHAISAAHSNVELAKKWHRGLDKAECLHVALRLSRAIGATDMAREVGNQMLEAASRELSTSRESPGVTLRLLRPLTFEKNPPEGINNLLDTAIESYDSPFIRDELISLKLRLSKNANDRRATHTQLVQNWMNAAEKATGLVRSGHLKKALETAQSAALPDLAERAAAALQRIREEDLGLARFSASSVIPQERFEEIMKPVTDCADWREALMNFVHSYGPAVGSIEETRKRVDEYLANSVFASIFTTELLGADGLPRFSPQSESDTEEMRMAHQETLTLQHTGPLLAAALHKIPDIHGYPDERELTEFLSLGKLTDEDLAASISRCLIRYWSGDAESAAFTAAPKIETLARNLLRELDAGIYRLQRKENPGQYPGLGALMKVLREKGLNESWYRNILTVCGNPAGGLNLRNDIAHGFLPSVGYPETALLIQCVLYLWSLGVQPGSDARDHG
jgi:hypothetical protein